MTEELVELGRYYALGYRRWSKPEPIGATFAAELTAYEEGIEICAADPLARATHSTNVPNSGTPKLKLFIDNNASANSRRMEFLVADVLIANA